MVQFRVYRMHLQYYWDLFNEDLVIPKKSRVIAASRQGYDTRAEVFAAVRVVMNAGLDTPIVEMDKKVKR
jgi:hypothetical protein